MMRFDKDATGNVHTTWWWDDGVEKEAVQRQSPNKLDADNDDGNDLLLEMLMLVIQDATCKTPTLFIHD